MKYDTDTYLKYDPFMDECEVLYHKTKLVKTRRDHDCMLSFHLMHVYREIKPHKMKAGQMARVDTAMVEGEWGKYYSCISCLDRWLDDQVLP